MKFKVNTVLNSKNTSLISGSLEFTGNLNSVFGTASYVSTASYSIISLTASYTTANLADTSSYSSTAITAGFAETSSFSINPLYAPTIGVGYISPTIYLGAPESAISNNAAFTGTMFAPFIVNRPVTVTTMSHASSASSGTGIIAMGIYSNSTNNLPNLLLVSGSASTTSTSPVILNYSLPTPLRLSTNTIYWLACNANNTMRFYYANNLGNMSVYNQFLGNKFSTTTAGIYPVHCLRSGSNINATLPPSASQVSTTYTFIGTTAGANLAIVPPTLPVMKVTY